jgi:hypothetical protein
MPKPPNAKRDKKPPDAEQRRALRLLASSPRGATEALLLAHGFRQETLAELVAVGLATKANETMRAGGAIIKVDRYRIIDAGRRAIEG